MNSDLGQEIKSASRALFLCCTEVDILRHEASSASITLVFSLEKQRFVPTEISSVEYGIGSSIVEFERSAIETPFSILTRHQRVFTYVYVFLRLLGLFYYIQHSQDILNQANSQGRSI